jgi:hypothetical protein
MAALSIAGPNGDGAIIVHLTDHAIERYVERFRAALDVDQAAEELAHMLPVLGVWSTAKPSWWEGDVPTDRYLMLGWRIAFPLVPRPNGYVATTCVVFHRRAKRLQKRAH